MRLPLRAPSTWALALLALVVALPTLATGYHADDWFFLWRALDPATAPEGAGGAFPRPAAAQLWELAVWWAGDSPLGMHLLQLLMFLGVALLAPGVLGRLLPDRAPAANWGVALLLLHPALWELRHWAAASNALLALLLALAGLRLATPAPAERGAPATGGVLLGLSGLARADLWACLPLALATRGLRPALLGLALPSLGLGWMLLSGGAPAPDLARGGELARRLLLPWGPALPGAAAAALGLLVPALFLGLAWQRRARPVAATAALLVALPLLAATVAPWGAAGRYLVVPVLGCALLLVDALGQGERPARVPAWAVALVLWLGLATVSGLAGRASGELRARAAAETSLYRAVQAHAGQGTAAVRLLDAPPMGLGGGPDDAANPVACALRRVVPVVLGEGEGAAGELVLRHVAGDAGWVRVR